MTIKEKCKNIQYITRKLQSVFIDKEQYEKRQCLTSISSIRFDNDYISNLIHTPRATGNVILGKDVISDIELYENYQNDATSKTLLETVSHTHLKGSKIYLKHLLCNPELSIELLQKRQEIIKSLDDTRSKNASLLQNMSKYEDDVLWLFDDTDENVKMMYDMMYFRIWFLKGINKSDVALTSYNIYRMLLSPMIGILSPIMYFVVPYMVLKYRYKIALPFKTYLRTLFESSKLLFSMNGLSSRLRYFSLIFSLVFYFQGVFNSVEISKTLYTISGFIIKKMSNIIKFINDGDALSQSIDNKFNVPDLFWGIECEPYKKLDYIINDKRWWIITNFGRVLKYFREIDKQHVKNLLSRSYMYDCLLSINKLNDYGFSYAKFENFNKPHLELDGVFHPCLEGEVVKNSIALGDKNMILTGPNAGGKSTLVKSLLINTLLCQTLTVSSSNKCTMTPFKYINSQINIPDCKGKESLFQAEMNRCKQNFDIINSLNQNDNKFSFIVMDEVFSSTSPIEGISGAYAVANHLSKNINLIVIFTTHFVYLTKLQKRTKRYTNYKMNVIKKDDDFIFPYTLEKGISTQCIALELLEKNGFDSGLIADAKAIRDRLLVV